MLTLSGAITAAAFADTAPADTVRLEVGSPGKRDGLSASQGEGSVHLGSIDSAPVAGRDVHVEPWWSAWRVEERVERDGRLVANWFLVDVSPYMVAGGVFLPDGQVQRMTEVAIP